MSAALSVPPTPVETAMLLDAPAPLDPLRSCPDGRYADDLVVVARGVRPGIEAGRRPDGRIGIDHHLDPAQLDDELASVLADVLAPLTDDHRVFAHAFTGLVLTSHPVAERAWLAFYRNTLDRLDRATDRGYSDIYRHARGLLPRTSVLDLGCSFGFLSLHLAARGTRVTACDLEPGTTRLLRRMAGLLRISPPPDVVLGHPGRIAARSASVDAVALLHVLEHVDETTGYRLLVEATRVARDRVVIAVPFETTATALYGHVRALDASDLTRWAATAQPGWSASIHEHLGGWLVLDRHTPRGPSTTW